MLSEGAAAPQSCPPELPFVLQNLWICLICGHIGCGRYVSRHAYKHFEETQHTYAMQLTNHRVWDYAGGELHALGTGAGGATCVWANP